jgi:hypothetical protein
MTTEELKGIAEFALNFAVGILQKGEELVPFAHVIGGDGTLHILHAIPGGGDVNSEKDAYADGINEMIRRTDGTAVVLVNDTLVVDVTHPEAKQRINQGERFTASQVIARGWGKKQEALIVTIESPNWFYLLKQTYRRNAAGAIILIDRVEMDSDDPRMSHREGRFYRFFRQQETV